MKYNRIFIAFLLIIILITLVVYFYFADDHVPTHADVLDKRTDLISQDEFTELNESTPETIPLTPLNRIESMLAQREYNALLASNAIETLPADRRGEALKLIQQIPSGSQSDLIRRALVVRNLESWLAQEPYEALDAAAELVISHPDDSETIAPRIIRQATRATPELALAWAQETNASGFKVHPLARVINELARNDFDLAYENVLTAVGEQHRSMAHAVLTGLMTDRYTSEATAEWVEKLDNSADKLAATQALAIDWAGDDPENAISWVEAIDDDDRRQAALKEILPRWIEQHPDTALEWINAHPEDPQAQAYLARARAAWDAEL